MWDQYKKGVRSTESHGNALNFIKVQCILLRYISSLMSKSSILRYWSKVGERDPPWVVAGQHWAGSLLRPLLLSTTNVFYFYGTLLVILWYSAAATNSAPLDVTYIAFHSSPLSCTRVPTYATDPVPGRDSICRVANWYKPTMVTMQYKAIQLIKNQKWDLVYNCVTWYDKRQLLCWLPQKFWNC